MLRGPGGGRGSPREGSAGPPRPPSPACAGVSGPNGHGPGGTAEGVGPHCPELPSDPPAPRPPTGRAVMGPSQARPLRAPSERRVLPGRGAGPPGGRHVRGCPPPTRGPAGCGPSLPHFCSVAHGATGFFAVGPILCAGRRRAAPWDPQVPLPPPLGGPSDDSQVHLRTWLGAPGDRGALGGELPLVPGLGRVPGSPRQGQTNTEAFAREAPGAQAHPLPFGTREPRAGGPRRRRESAHHRSPGRKDVPKQSTLGPDVPWPGSRCRRCLGGCGGLISPRR